jgi:hypothetical protein
MEKNCVSREMELLLFSLLWGDRRWVPWYLRPQLVGRYQSTRQPEESTFLSAMPLGCTSQRDLQISMRAQNKWKCITSASFQPKVCSNMNARIPNEKRHGSLMLHHQPVLSTVEIGGAKKMRYFGSWSATGRWSQSADHGHCSPHHASDPTVISKKYDKYAHWGLLIKGLDGTIFIWGQFDACIHLFIIRGRPSRKWVGSPISALSQTFSQLGSRMADRWSRWCPWGKMVIIDTVHLPGNG